MYIHWYVVSLAGAPRKKDLPKNESHTYFTNKPLNFINVAKILCNKEIIDSCPDCPD